MNQRSYRRARLWVLGTTCVAVLAACRGRERTETEVEVRSVGFDSVSQAPVVVLQDHDHRVALPIWIGPTEAQAIAMQLEGVAPPRPMTHDLMKTMLDQAGIELQKVVIQDLKDSTYIARIYLRNGRQDLQIDSRPSDAIALAVRFHSPIFVATGLLKGATTIDLQREAPAESTLKVAGLTLQNLTTELAVYFSLPPGAGVLVADVADGAATGLRRGDVILEIDGQSVSGIGDFSAKLHALRAGTRAQLSVQRGSERVHVPFAAHAG